MKTKILIAIFSLLLFSNLKSQVIQEWVSRYNGTGNAEDVAHSITNDSEGNIYVTGGSFGSETNCDFLTIKYNSSGIQQWIVRYNGPANDTDETYSIKLDHSGNVYVTGYSTGIGTGF